MNDMETNEKTYTLRRLKDKDLFPILDIIGKVFPEDLGSIFAQIMTGDKSLDQVGAEVVMKLVMAVLKNMDKVHDDVYTFLADVTGLTPEAIQDMPFGTTPMMIWDIVKNEKDSGFFGAVSKSL